MNYLKKNYLRSVLVISLFALLLIPSTMLASPPDSIERKNTIRLELVHPMIVGGETFVLGYERMLGINQSASLNFGTLDFALFNEDRDSSSLNLISEGESKGFTVSADYRFYLYKINKFNGPRGVYIGPYLTYNYFSRTNAWKFEGDFFTGEINSDFNFSTATVGFELGYQFVFWNRMSLDFVISGPGITAYRFNAGIDTNLSSEDENNFFEDLNDILSEKIPGYDKTITGDGIDKQGVEHSFGLGYRYIVMVGYRF